MPCWTIKNARRSAADTVTQRLSALLSKLSKLRKLGKALKKASACGIVQQPTWSTERPAGRLLVKFCIEVCCCFYRSFRIRLHQFLYNTYMYRTNYEFKFRSFCCCLFSYLLLFCLVSLLLQKPKEVTNEREAV
jgi:hypothetical protein